MSDKAANKHQTPTPSPLLTPSPLQKDELDREKLPVRQPRNDDGAASVAEEESE